MSDMNIVILKGRLTRDPKTRTVGSGKTVVDFSIAVNHTKEKVSFFNCFAWEKTGETIAKYLSKGDLILVRGEIEQQSWEAEGQKKSVIKINVREFNFLPKANKAEAQSEDPEYNPVPTTSDDDIPF